MRAFIKLLAFFLVKSVANAANDYNVMIAYHSDKDLGLCSEWVPMIDAYMAKRANRYVEGLVGTIEWQYDTTVVEEPSVRALRGSRELSCGKCDLCQRHRFPYCYALYYCQGCIRRNLAEGEVDDRHLGYLETAANRISRGCKTTLNRAGAGGYPRAGLSGECMDVLADHSTGCLSLVERI
jgi:hypothetical protein